MLKQIRLKNFVKFTGEETVKFDVENGRTLSLLAPSGSGKSCFLEAIRRCSGSAINTSVSTMPDKQSPSVVICHFEKEAGAGINKKNIPFASIYMSSNSEENKPGEARMKKDGLRHTYKVLVRNEGRVLILYREDGQSNSCEKRVSENEWKNYTADIDEVDRKTLLDIDKETEEITKSIDNVVSKMELSQNSFDDVFQSLARIEFVFATRTLGAIQSSLQLIANPSVDDRYKEVSKNAFIISQFLQNGDDPSQYDKVREEEIFGRIIGFDHYSFIPVKDELKGGEKIFVKTNISTFPLLKAPEGAIEAKHLSICLSKTDIDILCIDEPSRGLNPGMLNRLVYCVLPDMIENKQVILASGNEHFLSLPRKNTHICDRKDKESTTVVSLDKLKTVVTHDILSALAFYRRVLFVEGPSDLQFMESMQQVLLSDPELLKQLDEQFEEGNTGFEQTLLELKIAPLHGSGKANNVATAAKQLTFQKKCSFLLDHDALEKTVKSIEEAKKRNMFFWKKDCGHMKKPIRDEQGFVYFQANGKYMAMMRFSKSKRYKNKPGTIEDIIIRECIHHDLKYHTQVQSTCYDSDCQGLLDFMKDQKVLSKHQDSKNKFAIIWTEDKLTTDLTPDSVKQIAKRLVKVAINEKDGEIRRFLQFLKDSLALREGQAIYRRRSTMEGTQ